MSSNINKLNLYYIPSQFYIELDYAMAYTLVSTIPKHYHLISYYKSIEFKKKKLHFTLSRYFCKYTFFIILNDKFIYLLYQGI